MKKFEYSWNDPTNYIGVVNHSELLHKRGQEGWEMVSVINIEIGSETRIRIYWKREIITPTTTNNL